MTSNGNSILHLLRRQGAREYFKLLFAFLVLICIHYVWDFHNKERVDYESYRVSCKSFYCGKSCQDFKHAVCALVGFADGLGRPDTPE